MIINSLVDYTPDCQGRGPGIELQCGQGVFSYIFAITTHWYTIFLQQPGIIKMPNSNSKLDLERYPQFVCENKIECK
jgi:hypothetical protein